MAEQEIRHKLDGFIRKYYLNQLVKGVLLGSALILGSFLFLNFTEYYGHFGSGMRAFLFWSFVGVLIFVLWKWVLTPSMGLYKLGKVISYEDAASIIGSHFSEVKDKLINLLQLEEMKMVHPDSALVLAGIAQKTKELKPIPFSTAINIKNNRKYFKYLAIPLLLTFVVLVFQSSIITEGSKRIFNYNQHFAIKAPFRFNLLNRNFEIPKGSDYEVKVELEGSAIPEEVYIHYQSQEIKMSRNEKGNFVYLLKNLTESANFFLSASGFSSDEFALIVNPVPTLTGSAANVYYPAYTGKPSEKLTGVSDFVVPEGSEIEWIFDTKDAENLSLILNGNKELLNAADKRGTYKVRRKFLKSSAYKVLLNNSRVKTKDTLALTIGVIPDQLPSVFVEQQDDSLDINQFYFLGNASDDYGVNKVTFNYRYTKSDDAGKVRTGVRTVPLNLQRSGNDAAFYYVLNMNALGMSPSEEVEYYFEAWDNDGIHGSKKSRTQPTQLRRKSENESRKDAELSAANVKNLMKDAFSEAKELQKQSKQVQDQLNRQKSSNWENKSKVEDLLNRQKEMFEKLENIKNEKDKLKQQKQEFQKNEEFQERQKQLDELFKQMQDPELKKLMDDIQKLLEKQANKEELKEKLNELENKNRDWAKDMEKLMEQYKQLQLEQKVMDNAERLDKLAEKEKEIAEKTATADKKEQEQLKKEQEEIKKEFNEIKEAIKEAEKLNEELESPMKLDMGAEESQSAESQMDQAEKNLENNKNKQASENEKKAAEDMKKAADKMKESMEEEKSKRMEEDYQKIRELLENLVEASFDQESIFTELSTLRSYNPKFIELNRRQMAVKEDCELIEDSLRELAKRQPMVSTFITREISRINQNMDYALGHLKSREMGEAAAREQFVMTGLNNLAVMLMESMENMQQQLSKKKKQGNGSCNNPGGQGQGQKGKGTKLSKGQQSMGESLQELQKKAQQQRNGKSGKDGNEGKDGEEGKQGQREMNKEYAKAALMQEALRRQLQEMRKALEQEGPEGKTIGKELQKTEEMMEQQERDLVNKKITPEMMKRQKEIETRMLEHEKADRNQKQEDKRESQNPDAYTPDLPPALKQYIKEKQHEREMLRSSPPELTPYYKEKSKEYLRSVN